MEPGLQLFPTARDFDQPGQIIAVDAEGIWSRELDVSSHLKIERRAESIPAFYRNTRTRAGLTMSFFGGSLTGDAERSRTLDIAIKAFGTQREITQGVDLRAAVDSVMHRLLFRADSKYYVISETVIADSVDFTLSRSSIDSLGGAATWNAAVKANASVSARDTSNTSLVMRLKPPMRVFYKVYGITPRRVGFSPGGLDSLVSTPLDIRGERPRRR